MTSQEREIAVHAMFEGIIAAFRATDGNSAETPTTRCMAMAQTALVNLESSGFKVVVDA